MQCAKNGHAFKTIVAKETPLCLLISPGCRDRGAEPSRKICVVSGHLMHHFSSSKRPFSFMVFVLFETKCCRQLGWVLNAAFSRLCTKKVSTVFPAIRFTPMASACVILFRHCGYVLLDFSSFLYRAIYGLTFYERDETT